MHPLSWGMKWYEATDFVNRGHVESSMVDKDDIEPPGTQRYTFTQLPVRDER